MSASARRFSAIAKHGLLLRCYEPPSRQAQLEFMRPKAVSNPQAVPITIFVSGPSRFNNRSIDALVIEMHPAVGEKFSRARCRNTALPRPAMRGEWL